MDIYVEEKDEDAKENLDDSSLWPEYETVSDGDCEGERRRDNCDRMSKRVTPNHTS